MEIETLLRILVRKWLIILPIFLVTFAATAVFTFKQPPVYEATATYVAKLSKRVTDNRDFAAVINILSSRVEIATTYAEVANSRRLRAIAAQKLNLPPQAVKNLSVSSRLIPGTNIVEIAVQGTNPAQVRDFTNTIGASTIEYVQGLYSTFTLEALDDATIPRDPISPNLILNLILGAVLGLTLGSGIALLAHFFQTSSKESKKSLAMETITEAARANDLSVMDLRQDFLELHAEFESTRRALNQIRASLRKTNSYAKDIRSAVYDLEKPSNGNHAAGPEVELEE